MECSWRIALALYGHAQDRAGLWTYVLSPFFKLDEKRVREIIGSNLNEDLEQFNQFNTDERGLLLGVAQALFKLRYGDVDPMHVDLATFARPPLKEIYHLIDEIDRKLGTMLDPYHLRKLAEYLFNDWNEIVQIKPGKRVLSILDLTEPTHKSADDPTEPMKIDAELAYEKMRRESEPDYDQTQEQLDALLDKLTY
jgi:hypothetical protein